MSDTLHCSECNAQTSESEDAPENAPLVYSCNGCGRITCDDCGSGGLCSSCDVDNMVETSDG